MVNLEKPLFRREILRHGRGAAASVALFSAGLGIERVITGGFKLAKGQNLRETAQIIEDGQYNPKTMYRRIQKSSSPQMVSKPDQEILNEADGLKAYSKEVRREGLNRIAFGVAEVGVGAEISRRAFFKRGEIFSSTYNNSQRNKP